MTLGESLDVQTQLVIAGDPLDRSANQLGPLPRHWHEQAPKTGPLPQPVQKAFFRTAKKLPSEN